MLSWQKKEKEDLGKVQSNFDSLEQIDGAFVDDDQKIYLFADEQYLRSSYTITNIDQGYPQTIADHWLEEKDFDLPPEYHDGIDAAIVNLANQHTYFFKDNHFIVCDRDTMGKGSMGEPPSVPPLKGGGQMPKEKNKKMMGYGSKKMGYSDKKNKMDHDQEEMISNGYPLKQIKNYWGKLKNNFLNNSKIDGVLTVDHKTFFFKDDQCLTWSNTIENDGGMADTGSITDLKVLFSNLPDIFQDGVDEIFSGADGRIHLFKDGDTAPCNSEFQLINNQENPKTPKPQNPISANWY